MKLGMVGLGRMGGNMVKRLEQDGHEVASYARSGGGTADTLADLVTQLDAPRVVWLMIPAGDPTEQAFRELLGLLSPGDVIVDGGNSNFRDSKRRFGEAQERSIQFVDAGVSGGIWGLEVGYCLMVGGEEEGVKIVEPAFLTLAPEGGYAHVAGPGSGHFTKMVHNGIEYGLMQSYAEGLNVLKHANVGLHEQESDAETTPLRDPDHYRYELDIPAIAEVWRRGSVIASWLLDLTAQALHESPTLDGYAGRVSDSGEGRWTVQAAVEEGVPVPVLAASLFDRFSSRGEADWGNRVLSAMRKAFGGHLEKSPES
jgi:6-phosphogluconate dehydrogenase